MSKRKLLLADDSITIQKVVNLTFADEGIEVISVGDGDSAMRKFDEFMPDLVMADVNMPGVNGYEICRIIKRTDETRNIPVILLVGSFEPFDENEARDAGADDFLTKPFQSIRQLVNKVTDLLDQKEIVREEIVAANEVRVVPPVDGFADTLELKGNEPADEFGDAGMDDEMIETSPANDSAAESETPVYQAETTIDYAKTQPLNADDLKGFALVSNEDAEREKSFAETPEERGAPPSFDEEARKLGVINEPYENEQEEEYPQPIYQAEIEEEKPQISETEPTADYYLPPREEFEKEISDAETLEPEVSYAPAEDRTANFSEAADEETEVKEVEEIPETESNFADEPQTTEVETETPETAANFANESPTTETVEEYEATRENVAEFATKSETESYLNETPLTEQQVETPASEAKNTPSLSFDDGDLLELPPLVEETGIRPLADAPKTETEPEKVEEPEPVKTLSPELIEAIAARVAEKLSDRVIRSLAAEVVPEVAEQIIKEIEEENLKK